MAWQPSNWFSAGRYDEFSYVEVDKTTMRDLRVLDTIQETTGTISYQDLTSLKVTADLPFVGDFDIGNNYIRIYSESTLWDDSITLLHGTFIPIRPATSYTGASSTGTITCYSLLLLAQDMRLTKPLCVTAGTLTVGYAEQLLREAGLDVIADDSVHILSGSRNYDAGQTHLEVANDLLSVAGFNSTGIDASGTARLTEYTDPTNRQPKYVFRDDTYPVIFAKDVTRTFDIKDVPNQVIVAYSPTTDEEEPLVAIAENHDPLSQFSIENRGRVVSAVEEVSEIDSQEHLQALADRLLIDKSSAVETVELRHSFVPYNMGDAMRVFYTRHNFDVTGVSYSRELSLIAGMPSTVKIRRFVRM